MLSLVIPSDGDVMEQGVEAWDVVWGRRVVCGWGRGWWHEVGGWVGWALKLKTETYTFHSQKPFPLWNKNFMVILLLSSNRINTHSARFLFMSFVP